MPKKKLVSASVVVLYLVMLCWVTKDASYGQEINEALLTKINDVTEEAGGELVVISAELSQSLVTTDDESSTRELPLMEPLVDLNVESKNLFWFGWAKFESGDDWSQTGGDGGHAYGRYQFDDRYSLAEFLRFCVETDSKIYEPLARFYRENDKGEAVLTNHSDLAADWGWFCAYESETFFDLQTQFAIKEYYQPARAVLLEKCDLDADTCSPVLRGAIMSVAIRDGVEKRSLHGLTDTYYAGISEAEWLARIHSYESCKHPDSIERWSDTQKAAAFRALGNWDVISNNASLPEKVLRNYGFELVYD